MGWLLIDLTRSNVQGLLGGSLPVCWHRNLVYHSALFGAWDCVFGAWDCVFGVWDCVFGVWEAIFGV